MKKLIPLLAAAFLAIGLTPGIAQANLENDPAYLAIDKAFDFKTVKPEVNINLPKFLLKDALADFNGSTNDPLAGLGINVSELIQDIKLIRVVVMNGKKGNAEAFAKGIATLKSTLDSKWTAIAVVSEQNENVGVYAIGDPSGDSIAGLAVLIHEGSGNAVVVNIVGRVSLGKVIKAASRMNKFPKDLLKKLSMAVEPEGAEKPKASTEKPAN